MKTLILQNQDLQWPFFAVERMIDFATALLFAFAAWRHYRASDWWRARCELAAAATGHQGIWLNRDEHMSFHVFRQRALFTRYWEIDRLPADAAREAVTADGQFPVTFGVFKVLPLASVVCLEETFLVQPGLKSAHPLPGRNSPRGLWRRLRWAQAGLGFAVLSPAEIRELAGQLAGAECLNPGM